MDFLKRLFGGGGGGPTRDGGMYFYIRNRVNGEVIRLRLDLNQLSPEYEGDRVTGYYTRKVVVGQKDFTRMDAEFAFDANKRLRDQAVSPPGEFVAEADWLAQQEAGGG